MALTTTMYIYNYTGDPRIVNKSLPSNTVNNTVNVYLSQNCDVMHPSVSIPYTDDLVQTFNYAYIPAWKRYYFVTGIQTDTGGKLWINMSIDVLKTYSYELLSANNGGVDVNVARWSGAGINWKTDDKLPVHSVITDKKIFPLTGGTGYPTQGNNILIGLI